MLHSKAFINIQQLLLGHKSCINKNYVSSTEQYIHIHNHCRAV